MTGWGSPAKENVAIIPCQVRRRAIAFSEHDFDPFFDNGAELAHDPGLRAAMTAGTDNGRRTAGKAAVLVGPLHEFEVAACEPGRGFCFMGGDFHGRGGVI